MSTINHPRDKTFYNLNAADISLTTYDNVQGSPSKLKYSFGVSKNQRFPAVKLRNHEQIGYDLPTTKNTRSAGFGIGERFQDQKLKLKKNTNPSPDRYDIPTVFQPDNTTSTFANHMKGQLTYSFGTGRDQFNKTVYNQRLGNSNHIKIPDQIVPGPGSYNPLKPIGYDSKSFKLKGKIGYGSVSYTGPSAIKRGIPGVGTYEDSLSIANNKMGLYNHNSEWNNSKATKWNPPQPHGRFHRPRITTDQTPGPGAHEQCGEIHKGNQVNSQLHSTKVPSFGIGGRARWVQRFQTPGPGAYRPPSDFGYVDIHRRRGEHLAVSPQYSREDINEYQDQHIQTATKSTLKHLKRGSLSGAKSPSREDYQQQSPVKFRTAQHFHKRKNTVQQPMTMNLTQNNFNQMGQDFPQYNGTGISAAANYRNGLMLQKQIYDESNVQSNTDMKIRKHSNNKQSRTFRNNNLMEITGGSKTPTAYHTNQVTTPKPNRDQNSDVAITLQQYNMSNNNTQQKPNIEYGQDNFSMTTPNTTVMENQHQYQKDENNGHESTFESQLNTVATPHQRTMDASTRNVDGTPVVSPKKADMTSAE